MRIKAALMSISMALLIPLTAQAKKPEPAECQIAVTGPLAAGSVFEVVVRPAPGAGPWTAPTIGVEVSLPINSPPGLGTSPDSYSQVVAQTFDGRPDIAKSSFIIPGMSYLDLDMGGTIVVFATVSEPVNRGRSVESFCEASANFGDL